jgi:multimeric flavodoxin WrbA
MKNTIIINLSPRKSGTSKMLAMMCYDNLISNGKNVKIVDLYSYLDDIGTILNLIQEADTIVMSGPSYIDHFPADTIYLLEQMSSHREILHGQSVYGMIQGGMPYVHTHESGLKTLELFCKDCNITYKGSFVIGLGAMLNGQPIDKLINGKKVKKSYLIFLNNISDGKYSPESLYKNVQIKLPSIVYKVLANRMNKSINKELLEKEIDFLQPSPYWKM